MEQSSRNHLSPGSAVARFEIIELVASGGMGEVYRALDTALSREVAIKVLPREVASDPSQVERFEREARAASALNHPNIVTIYEIGDYLGSPYIAMEYVQGQTLRKVADVAPLSTDELVRYGHQISRGLAKAHSAGIVHRDLKPENVIVNDDGFVKILDFGLAKLMPRVASAGGELETWERQTMPGTILGTVGYLSPEQARAEPVDFRSDQFSLGAMLYELATGKRAFDKATAAQTLAAIMESDPHPVERLNPAIPEDLASVITRCLSKDPAARFSENVGDCQAYL